MKNVIYIVLILILLPSCQNPKKKSKILQVNWESRLSDVENFDDFVHGKTYLPVYSHIYHRYEQRAFDLTITASIRNISTTDTVYILKADYFNTHGDNIRQYVKKPIFIKPMETVEIIITEEDKEGGSGANFIFDWMVKDGNNDPLFEAVMISTHGQQGLSFSTRGVRVYE